MRLRGPPSSRSPPPNPPQWTVAKPNQAARIVGIQRNDRSISRNSSASDEDEAPNNAETSQALRAMAIQHGRCISRSSSSDEEAPSRNRRALHFEESSVSITSTSRSPVFDNQMTSTSTPLETTHLQTASAPKKGRKEKNKSRRSKKR